MIRILSILIFIFIIGFLIFIHEFGHFLQAKMSGIGVVEFSVGIGPKLFSFVKNGTRYCLRAFPFGGYCQMLGQEQVLSGEEGIVSDEEHSYENKKWPVRLAVILAGPVMNMLVALVLSFVIVSLTGIRTSEVMVMRDSPLSSRVQNETVTIKKINGIEVSEFDEVKERVSECSGSDITIELDDGGEIKTLVVTPEYDSGSYVIGVMSLPTKSLNAGETFKYGFKLFGETVSDVFNGIIGLFTGKTSLSSLVGPVGMMTTVGDITTEVDEEMADYSAGVRTKWFIVTMLEIMSILSVNLCFMNMLPIPGLDGGRFLMILAEGIRGKRLSKKAEGVVNVIGFALVALLSVAVLFKDVFHLFTK